MAVLRVFPRIAARLPWGCAVIAAILLIVLLAWSHYGGIGERETEPPRRLHLLIKCELAAEAEDILRRNDFTRVRMAVLDNQPDVCVVWGEAPDD